MAKYFRFHTVVNKNEFRAIRGAGYRTIIYLACILYITFLCIGFSGNALVFQDKLARSPLSNWVNIGINRGTRDSVESLVRDLSGNRLKTPYFIQNFYLSKEFGASFLDRSGRCTGLPLPKARTIDPQSPVIHDLFMPGNVVRAGVGSRVFVDQPFGFVVTGSLMKKLGFDCDSVSWLSYRIYGSKYVPVPVLAVLKELPDHADVVCTDSFYMMQMHNYPDDSLFSKLFIETRDAGTVAVIKAVIRDITGIPGQIPLADSIKGFNQSLRVIFFPNNIPATGRLFGDNLCLLRTMKETRNLHFGTYYEVKPESPQAQTGGMHGPDGHDFNFDYLALEFSRLDRIRDFSVYIKNRYAISMNMETVSQRQNYLFSLNISLGAIILVLILSVISIVIFISDTLKNHLDRVKRNLGNFLAFGTSGNRITAIYVGVVMEILLLSASAALILAWISGELFDRYLLRTMLVLDREQDYFSLFNLWLLMFLAVVFTVAVLKTIITVTILVRQSPGDLIYERVSR